MFIFILILIFFSFQNWKENQVLKIEIQKIQTNNQISNLNIHQNNKNISKNSSQIQQNPSDIQQNKLLIFQNWDIDPVVPKDAFFISEE